MEKKQLMAIIAISAGHTKGTGALAVDGTQEYDYNSELADLTQVALEGLGHTCHILHREPSLSYGMAMSKLADEMKSLGAVASLELHFNAASPSAHGAEFLHWFGSTNGNRLARCIADQFAHALPYITMRGDRGVRSLWYHNYNESKAYSGRGGGYVYKTPCPAVICEPFFGSNNGDLQYCKAEIHKIAQAYALGLNEFLK